MDWPGTMIFFSFQYGVYQYLYVASRISLIRENCFRKMLEIA